MNETLADLLVRHEERLRSIVGGLAGGRLLRFETVDDLVQGILTRALDGADRFEYQGEGQFVAWLREVARHHVLRRASHWGALKRSSARVLRLIETEGRRLEIPAGGTTPSSFAGRREQVHLLAEAMSALRPKDRLLLERSAAGASLEELAAELGVAYDAAKQARLRALERLRKAYRVLLGDGTPPGR